MFLYIACILTNMVVVLKFSFALSLVVTNELLG
jgi:hypothetical protein